jgi:hypothetical protein
VNQNVALAAVADWATIDLLADFKADGGVQQAVTVARTHLILTVHNSTTNDPGDQFAWGLIRGQNSDVGASIPGAPRPSLDSYEDWLLWETLTADTAGKYYPGNGNTWRYDLKAMRRLEELQMSYNAVFESISAAATFDIQITGRILLMLP